MSVAVIVPTYGQYEYAELAVRTAYLYTPGCSVYLLDDHGPGWREGWASALAAEFPTFRFHRFAKNGGLTRSWNEGLRWARKYDQKYAVAANSDVLFTPGWFEPLAWALDHGADLAGPMTNAPGHQPKQQVARHLPDYKITDDPTYLADVAARLAAKNPEVMTALRVNGFCMAAKTATWWANAHTPDTVFDPKHKMTKNEDELQGRWKKRGLVSAMVPASFVFHYRGVTRTGATKGQEGKGWFRRAKKKR